MKVYVLLDQGLDEGYNIDIIGVYKYKEKANKVLAKWKEKSPYIYQHLSIEVHNLDTQK